ncbi:MAG: cell division protein FtsQ/DivIB [Candidatus Microsaccharimonas sp.]
MFSKRSSRGKETVPRRRRIADDEFGAGGAPRRSPQPSSGTSTSQFKRNRTLSSYRHNTPEESSRQKAHTLASQRRKIGGLFFIVAMVAVLLGLLLWQLIAQVHVTTTTKQLTTSFDARIYEDTVNEYLNLNPSQRLRLSLNEAALSAYVSEALPEVESLELSGMPGVAQSNLAITFRTPVAGWQINSKQYFVDAHGVVFEKNYYEAPTVQIVDESGVSPEQGSAVVGSRTLGFLGRAVAQAQGRGYTIVKAALPQDTTREVDIYFDGISSRVKLSIDRGAGEQIEDADRSIKYLQSRGVAPEYIDVRVSGRAAYR